MIHVKRVYDEPKRGDGARYLVDRLWPRGIKKEKLPVEGWLKGAAPSNALRRWFGHDPARWDEFRRRYFAELDANPEALDPVRKTASRRNVTLLYGARDADHNNAVALKEYLERS